MLNSGSIAPYVGFTGDEVYALCEKYEQDFEEVYFHIYYSDQKACAEHEQIEAKIDRMTKYLNSLKG